jgi:signal transduction histidine kinase
VKIKFRFFIVLLIITIGFTTFSQASPEGDGRTLHVIGVSDDFPMMFSDRNGHPVGLAVDLLRAFSEEFGYTLVIDLVRSSQGQNIFSMEADIYYDGGNVVPPESMRPTIPFYIRNYYLFTDLSRANYLEKSLLLQKDFNEIQIGYKSGAPRINYFSKIFDASQLVSIDNYDEAITLWIQDELDAIIMPVEIGTALITEKGLKSLGHGSTTLFLEDNSFWVSPEQVLIQFDLNNFIQNKKKNGEIQALTKAWINYPLVKNPRSQSLSLFNYFFLITAFATFAFSYRSYHLERSVKKQANELILINKENETLWSALIIEERYKNEYFINLSHELRTPISLILNAVNAVERVTPSEPKGAGADRFFKYTGIAKNNSLRLLRVINNLIDANHLEHKDYELDFKSVEAVYEIQELIKLIKESVEPEDLKLSFVSRVEALHVDVDPYEMDRIVLNLISNAIKFNYREPSVEIILDRSPTTMVLEIIDNSFGIPTELIPKAFQKYHQLETEFSKKVEGAGFGLYLAKALVELHKGTLETLEPKNGQGMHFKISVPLIHVVDEKKLSTGKSLFYDRSRLVKMELSEIKT